MPRMEFFVAVVAKSLASAFFHLSSVRRLNGRVMPGAPVDVVDECDAPNAPIDTTLPAGRGAEEAAPLAIGDCRAIVSRNATDRGVAVNPPASHDKVARHS